MVPVIATLLLFSKYTEFSSEILASLIVNEAGCLLDVYKRQAFSRAQSHCRRVLPAERRVVHDRLNQPFSSLVQNTIAAAVIADRQSVSEPARGRLRRRLVIPAVQLIICLIQLF